MLSKDQTIPPTSFTLTIHMVSSLDGVIAKKDNSVSWFETTDHYESGVELTQPEIDHFLAGIDCYIMGANTYSHAQALSEQYGWAYGDKPCVVLSHRNLPVERPGITVYQGNLETLVQTLLKPKYKNVWLVGGAMLAKAFLRLQLANEIRLSVLPVLLGEGTRFFDESVQEQALHLKSQTAYKSGMVELCYEIKK